MSFTLSKTNIAQGNTIQPADVSQSVDALTGLYAYRITISGSLNLTGSTVTGSTANFAQVTASLFGTGSWAVSSSRSVSSSRALAANTATTATSANTADGVSNQYYDNGTQNVGTFDFVAGKVILASGVGSSSVFSVLNGKVLGVNAFITTTYSPDFVFSNPTEPANLIVSVTGDGRVAVIQQSPSVDNGTIIFTGMYI
jgi:hypothetical protein